MASHGSCQLTGLKLLSLHTFCLVSLIILALFLHVQQEFCMWQGVCCEVWVKWQAFCVLLLVRAQLLVLAMCYHLVHSAKMPCLRMFRTRQVLRSQTAPKPGKLIKLL